MSRENQGVLFVGIFSLIAGIQDVYLGYRFQIEDPALLSFLISCVAFVFYAALNASRISEILRAISLDISNVVFLNLSTAASWIGFFFALKFLEPAIVSVLALGLAPFLSLILYPILRPEKSITLGEKVSSLGIGLMIFLLALGTYQGHTGLGQVSLLDTVKGFSWGLLSAFGAVGNTMYSKKLYDKKWVPKEVMCVRFIALILFSFPLIGDLNSFAQLNVVSSAEVLVLAFAIYIIPIYILHLGFERCEPMTAALILAASPLFAIILQTLDRRITFSYYTLSLVSISLLLSIYGTLSKYRSSQMKTRD